MPKLKIYLRTTGDISDLIKAYQEVFKAQVVKKSFFNKQDIEQNKEDKNGALISYAYLTLFDSISIMIAKHKPNMPSFGYSHDNIIYLEDADLFVKTYEKIKKSKAFKIDYHPQKFAWGTTIFKAYDQWNNGWVVETRT